MEERTKFHVGLDVHKDSISIGAAELGRAPARLIGKVPHDLNLLLDKFPMRGLTFAAAHFAK